MEVASWFAQLGLHVARSILTSGGAGMDFGSAANRRNSVRRGLARIFGRVYPHPVAVVGLDQDGDREYERDEEREDFNDRVRSPSVIGHCFSLMAAPRTVL